MYPLQRVQNWKMSQTNLGKGIWLGENLLH